MYVAFDRVPHADYLEVSAVPNGMKLGRIRGRTFTPEPFTGLLLGELREILERMEWDEIQREADENPL